MPPKRKVKSGKMDRRKTRQPVADHPNPTPATGTEKASTQAMRQALYEIDYSSLLRRRTAPPPPPAPPPPSEPPSEPESEPEPESDSKDDDEDDEAYVTFFYSVAGRVKRKGTIAG